MKTNTAEKIINYIKNKKQVTAKSLVDHLNISRQGLFKHLPKLLEQGKIKKIGKPLKVFYQLTESVKAKKEYLLDEKLKKVINESYLIITPSGEMKKGISGFEYFCEKNNLPLEKTAKEYQKTLQKYSVFKKNSLINGMYKMKGTFGKVFLDDLYYLDFYSIERFGKTKLGQLLLYAKQSQNKKLIKDLVLSFKGKIELILKKYKIDAVGFIPPTVKREVQFMKELEKNLKLKIKSIHIVKVKTPIIIPQKTLNKLTDRIENAQKTIIVDEVNAYKNILLIDDAVGSGATLNETAKQLKNKGICTQKVIGLVITGSFKGFDVISEV